MVTLDGFNFVHGVELMNLDPIRSTVAIFSSDPHHDEDNERTVFPKFLIKLRSVNSVGASLCSNLFGFFLNATLNDR